MKVAVVLSTALHCVFAFECGRRHDYHGGHLRIVGGTEAMPNEFPWQVELPDQECGGSILNEYWIVTAASCVRNGQRGFKILAGKHNLKVTESTEQITEAYEVIQHPSYDSSPRDYDVALVRLARPLSFNYFVGPVCLPESYESYANAYCTATGWGQLYHGGPAPDQLQKVDLPVWEKHQCVLAYGHEITDRMFCAGYEQGGKDTCIGDTGGPLVCKRRDGRWDLAGITSWGRVCGAPHSPGVFTSVTSVLAWIKSIFGEGHTGCGSRKEDGRSARVIGGAVALPHEFPWQVYLPFRRCGGSIVDAKWVITAAHCLSTAKQLWLSAAYRRGQIETGQQEAVRTWSHLIRGTHRVGTTISILAGKHTLETEESSQQLRRVVEVIIHPKYSEDTIDFDVALLKLASPLNYSEQVGPVCLPETRENYTSSICTASGWGILSPAGPRVGCLRKVDLPLWNQKDCKLTYQTSGYQITDRMLCAGYKQGGKDTCRGDSGGPLVCQREDGKWTLVGVTSWGGSCGAPGEPGVFTRVASVMDWINRVIDLFMKSASCRSAGYYTYCKLRRRGRSRPSCAPQGTMKLVIVLVAAFSSALAGKTCGKRRHDADIQRIVGGKPAKPHEFPWQVEVRINGSHWCGASVLNKKWIIGAAHCFRNPGNPDYWFVFGKHNITKKEKLQESRRVSSSRIIRHPKYNIHVHSDYDVALIPLSKPLQLNKNPHIAPICLPEEDDEFVDVMCTATGWGRTDSGVESDVLYKVDVPVWRDEDCRRSYTDEITESMMCAGYPDGGKDSCHGDSGGPLVCPINDDTWVLAGITSWGWYCGLPNSPGVYTRVTSVLDWIVNTIKGSYEVDIGIHPVDPNHYKILGREKADESAREAHSLTCRENIPLTKDDIKRAAKRMAGVEMKKLLANLLWRHLRLVALEGPYTRGVQVKPGLLIFRIIVAAEVAASKDRLQWPEEMEIAGGEVWTVMGMWQQLPAKFLQGKLRRRGRSQPSCAPQGTMKLVIVLVAALSSALAGKTCGQRRHDADIHRIVGGKPAKPHEFPWQVEVLKNGFQHCGASVLNKKWIIGAAHCFRDPEIPEYWFVFGKHNITKKEKLQETRRVSSSRIIRHPKFDIDAQWDYDVALIPLSKPLQLNKNPHIAPICLPEEDEDFVDVMCTATGWGLTGSGHGTDVLYKVDVPVWRDEDCRRSYRHAITESMMCAGYPQGGKDTCGGDSGGPLVCPINDDTWVLAGITSWGRDCGLPNSPGVYTRVTSVLDWIVDTIKRS
ncbi:transmembrane protease serine 9-like [Ornithodoros turicata]|uniref:transmembrane protease serine 9-like n=1 Tax=Ornithodoros turicata TaxID=34597 RepID=UPI0031392466